MGRLTAYFLKTFRLWDRSAQVGFLLALLLGAVVAVVFLAGPPALRQPALIGLIGLVIALQVIFMWANRGLVTPFTQAQRAYLQGDFDTACRLLEAMRGSGKASVQALTLLGNAYRQQGDLERSESVLAECLEIEPNHYFPLYGFGRTLLVTGRYGEAITMLRRAAEAGAPEVVQLDLGEALYRNGQPEAAHEALQSGLVAADDPARRLMGNYLLYRLGTAAPPDPTLIDQGLAFWQASATRFAQSPYGAALAQDVLVMQGIMKER